MGSGVINSLGVGSGVGANNLSGVTDLSPKNSMDLMNVSEHYTPLALHPDMHLDLGHHSHPRQEPLNQRTYHADDFLLAPVVVVITH
jgi:hypothetical protein